MGIFRNGENENNSRVPGDAGQEWFKQKLLELSTIIYKAEVAIQNGESGSRLSSLKQLVTAYNKLLITIFGKENAQRMVNLKVEGNTVVSYIPKPGKLIPEEKRKSQKATRAGKPKRRTRDQVSEDSLVGYDSDDVAYQLLRELQLIKGQAQLKISYREDIAVGTGYVVITDPISEQQFYIPFHLKMDLTFVKLVWEVFCRNNYPVEIVVHKDDLEQHRIAPKDDSWRWN